MKKDLMIGILLVTGGAMSYGVLATFVRLAYNQGYTPSEVTFSQYFLGVLAFGLIYLLRKEKSAATSPSGEQKRAYFKLMLGGSAFGLTGMFYYFSVQYLPVSVCVVLLMQSIWMGVLIECIFTQTFPSRSKIVGSWVVLFGTLLATNVVQNMEYLPPVGIFWGLAAAVTYAISMAAANRIATSMRPEKRSFYMLLGAFIAVSLIGVPSLMVRFDLSIFWSWGLLLAFFGTILPPLLFNIGMPKTGVGLGAILISIEIPVSVGMAFFVLQEEVAQIQWFGILLIILAVVLLNYKLLKKSKKVKNKSVIQSH